MSDASPNADPAGISLPQYAAIEAALGEGFPLREVLGIESVERDAWSEAEPAWKERITAPVARKNGLFERYKAERTAAEDWLFRRVTPLDEDAAAWVTFQLALANPQTARDLLKVTGLRMNDVARLTRLWARKVEIDPSLNGRLADLGKKGPGKLPDVKAAPPALRRSKTAGAPKSAPVVAPAQGASPQTANRDVLSPQPGSSVADVATPAGPAAQPSFMSAPAAVPSFMASGAPAGPARPSFMSASPAASPVAHLAAPATPAPAARPAPGGTVDVSAILAGGSELPFSDKPAAPEVSTPSGPGAVAAKKPAPSGTVDVASILANGPALPFPEEPAPPAPPVAPAKKPAAAGTVDVSAILASGPALPFSDEPAPPPPPASLAPLESKADKRPPAGGTVDVSAIFAGRATPFEDTPPAPAEPPAPKKPPAAGTVDVSAILAAGPLLPFADKPSLPAASDPPKVTGTGATPFQSAPAPAPAASPVDLTVEQYASFCVEVHLRPDRAGDALSRYRISPQSRPALDVHWQRRLSTEPQTQAAFSRAYESYKGWLEKSAAPPSASGPASRASVPTPQASAKPIPQASTPVAPAAQQAPSQPTAPPPDLTVEQYASLTVDLKDHPAHRAETLARYRLTEAQAAQLDAAWRARLSSSMLERAGFDHACKAYRAWRAGGGR